MRKFLEILRMELKLYIRGIWLWLIIASLSIYLVIGYYNFFIKEFYGAGQLLQSSSFIVMAGALLGMVSGIISSRRETVAKFEEVLTTLPRANIRILGKITAWAIIVITIIIIAITEVFFMYIYSGSHFIHLWQMSANYIVVYWGMTLFSAGLIGYGLDKLLNSTLVYPVIFIIWIIISPYNEIFLPKNIAFLLNQGEENPNATYNDFSGLNISFEIFLRHLFLFLVTTFITCLALLIYKKMLIKKKQRVCIISSMIIISILAISIAPFINHKLMFDSEDFNNSDEFEFYKNLQTSNSINENYYEKPIFEVTQYDIILTHNKNKLYYDLTTSLKVPENENINWLNFTLYHGLQIKKIQVDNKDIEWKREGDFILIKWNKNYKDKNIHFQITWDGGTKNWVTPSSFCLTPSIMWYPVPGKWKLAELNNNLNVQYKNLSQIPKAKFNIKVTNEEKIFSNLPYLDINKFQGEANSVTLLYGKLIENEIDGIKVVAPIDYIENISPLLPDMNKIIKNLGETLGAGEFHMPKYIFIVPLSACGTELPINYINNQLFIDCFELRILFEKPSSLLCNSQLLLPAFYWFNEYHDKDGVVPIMLPMMYDCLYLNSEKKSQALKKFVTYKYPKQYNTCIELQQIGKSFLQLYEAGYERELKIMLNQWYKQAKEGYVDVETLKALIEKVGK